MYLLAAIMISVEQQQADWEKLKSQEEGHKQTSLKEEIALVPESFPALIRGQKIAKKAAAAGMFSTEDEDVFKDLLTSVVNLQLGTAGEDPEKKFSSDEELSEKLGEVLFALCRFCAKYKVSGGNGIAEEAGGILIATGRGKRS